MFNSNRSFIYQVNIKAKNTVLRKVQVSVHKKNARPAGVCYNVDILPLTLATSSEFWCIGRDFNRYVYWNLYCIGVQTCISKISYFYLFS